jgi:hypothetical protein
MNGLGGNKFLLKLFILFFSHQTKQFSQLCQCERVSTKDYFFFMRVTIAFSIVEIKILNFFILNYFLYFKNLSMY